MISRSNYEIWFMGWLEGKLSDLNRFRLQKKEIKFKGKESLKRSPADLTEGQFDYLCAAHLENDLSPEQETELEEIIAQDPERRNIYLSFLKTRLVKPGYKYPYTNSLKRKTLFRRLLLPAIGTAACITLIISFYAVHNRNLKNIQLAGEKVIGTDTLVIETPRVLIDPSLAYVQKPVFSKSQNFIKNIPDTVLQEHFTGNADEFPVAGLKSVSSPEISTMGFSIEGLPDLTGEDIIPGHKEIPSFRDDNRGRVSKFLTLAYRELLLGEKNNRPLNRYELAKGGINGLNRLLGWKMELTATNDENGNAGSVYFSSKVLKLNIPVKKITGQ